MALRSACPALTTASVHIQGNWRNVLAAMRALGDCGGESTAEFLSARFMRSWARNSRPEPDAASLAALNAAATLERGDDFASFATALGETLGCCRVKTLLLGSEEGCAPSADFWAYVGRLGPDAAATESAAASLGAALAHPLRGPRELRVWGSIYPLEPDDLDEPPCFLAAAHVARALTAQSPLRALTLGGIGADALEELAAALAPGRSRLEELEIEGANLGTAQGCECARQCARPPTAVFCFELSARTSILLRMAHLLQAGPPRIRLLRRRPPPQPHSHTLLVR